MSTGSGPEAAGRSGGLTSTATAWRWLSARLSAAVETVPLALAHGRIAAEPLRAQRTLPAQAAALMDGVAVSALDTVGAGPYAPAPLSQASLVARGGSLPPGTDAILHADAVALQGGLSLALAPATPGEGVRRAGEDAKAGAILCKAGRRLGATTLAVLKEAGLGSVRVVRLRLAVDGADSSAAVQLATALASAAGIVPVPPTDEADLRWCVGDPPRSSVAWQSAGIALRPGGESCRVGIAGTGPMLLVPDRPETVLAAWLALVEPACLAASGARPLRVEVRAKAKVASTPGVDDLVLLARSADDPGAWDVLSSGDAPWSLLAQAEAAGIIPAESEGQPPGVPISVVVL